MECGNNYFTIKINSQSGQPNRIYFYKEKLPRNTFLYFFKKFI